MIPFFIKRWWARQSRKQDEKLLFPEFRKAAHYNNRDEEMRYFAYDWMVKSYKEQAPCWRPEYD